MGNSIVYCIRHHFRNSWIAIFYGLLSGVAYAQGPGLVTTDFQNRSYQGGAPATTHNSNGTSFFNGPEANDVPTSENFSLQRARIGQSIIDIKVPLAENEIDLNTVGRSVNGLNFFGEAFNDRTGFSVSGAGDVNGDGVEDFLIGAPGADNGTEMNVGAVYLVLGSGNRETPLGMDGALVSENYIKIFGETANDQFGLTVSGAGDFNGDGLSDFLVGAPLANGNEGLTYLIFGSTSLFVPGNNLEVSGLETLEITGETGTDVFTGSSLSGLGDINGDNFDDIVIGAKGGSNDAGSIYVLFGNSNSSTPFNLITAIDVQTGFKIIGSASDNFGRNVTGVGDINQDGYNDLLVGGSTGSVYLIYGSDMGFNAIYGQNTGDQTFKLDNFILGSSGWDFDGNGVDILGVEFISTQNSVTIGEEHSGTSIAGAGDVNGDGFNDLLISSVDDNANAGTVYLVYGSTTNILFGELNLTAISQERGVIFKGLKAEDFTGLSVAGAGDINGDGLGDIAIGAFGARNEHGSTYLIFGQQGGIVNPGTKPLPLFDLGIKGPEGLTTVLHLTNVISRQRSGWAVSAAGDVNGDGFSEVIVGAPFEAGKGSGRAYILYGGADHGPPLVPEHGETYSQTIRSGRDNLNFEKIEPVGLGLIGDGSHSIPLSRVSIGFGGGGTGTDDANASTQTVTRFHQPVPDFTHDFWDPPEVLEKAAVYWRVNTNRRNTLEVSKMTSTIVFHFSDQEISALSNSEEIRVFFSPDPPTSGSCWTPLPFKANDLDLVKRTIRVNREHLQGQEQGDINGYYTLMRANWVYELGQYIPAPCISVNTRPDLFNNLLESIPPISSSSPTGNATENGFWHLGTNRLYASGARSDNPLITDDGVLTIDWKRQDGSNIVVVGTQIVKTRWPGDDADFQFYISDSTSIDLTEPNQGDDPYQSARLLFRENTNQIEENNINTLKRFKDSGEGRSLLLVSSGPSDVNDPIFFIRVKTISHDDADHLLAREAIIGQEIMDLTLHDEFCGSPWIFDARDNAINVFNSGPGYYQLQGNTVEEREASRRAGTGPIIPVNETRGAAGDLVVVYYERSRKILSGELSESPPGSGEFRQTFLSNSTMCWGYQAVNYGSPRWPDNPNKIIIASLSGTGPLDASFGPVEVYVQNDPNANGYNPNEEHALELGGTVYALRNDLNDPGSTSKPYVLVNFNDPENFDRPSMAVWKVEVEDRANDVTFNYEGTAGKLIQAPLPISILHATAGNCANSVPRSDLESGALASGSYRVSGEVFEDKNHDFWAIAAGDDGGSAEIVMRHWYPVRSDFYFPDLPATLEDGQIDPGSSTGIPGTLSESTCVPWLDHHINVDTRPDSRPSQEDGTPVDIRFTMFWPDLHPNPDFREEVPELRIGETLVRPAAGLPDITGRISAEIVYQQSVNNDAPSSVVLNDPLREFAVSLLQLPEDTEAVRDIDNLGIKIVFNQLPPHLQPRLSYDPAAQKLVFKGLFVEPALGDSFILPNVLTASEIAFLTTEFSTDTNWVTAIKKLPTPDDTFANTLYLNKSEFTKDDATVCAPFMTNGIDNTDPIITLNTPDGDLRVFVDGVTSIFDAKSNDAELTQFDDVRTGGFTHACVFSSSEALVGDPVGQTKGLSATGEAEGYVTLVFENDPITGSLPVVVQVIKVNCPLTKGMLTVIEPECVFDEKLTLRHTADLGGRSNEYIYEWRTLPDVNGVPPSDPPETWLAFDPGGADADTGTPGKQVQGALDITIGGPGIFTLSDNWFIMRYRKKDANPADPSCTAAYSDWTNAQLAPGWIKRVMGRITPFTQRISEGGLAGAEDRFARYRENQINTIVSMLTQAGPRWTGDVALNCANLNASPQEGGNGLIEIYETVLGRGRDFSINAIPPVDYAPANTSLLFAASRIADLYMLFGNEAFADASDPTIAISSEINGAATSIHAFMNQTANLLEEELVLLRGRDDTKAPGVQLHPVYNRFVWNFTTDFTGGELAYALNYNIKDASGNVDGEISEDDAAILYPQGHGDAWGHYLQAIKTYYKLLRHPQYTWTPRAEAVLVAGQPVTVDFFDERKFVNAAAAKARTGAAIVNLTYRANYSEDPEDQWQGYKDTDPERAWGLAEWGSRAGQGAYFDWVVGNAIIPDEDTSGDGIQKVDRTTVWELHEVSAIGLEIQQEVDNADKGLNPLGLAKNVLPFDIDPKIVVGEPGQPFESHFDQVFARALTALTNATTAFDFANNAAQALRSQADDIGDFQDEVEEAEFDFRNRLIEIFGRPYPEDIGTGKTYPAGYEGPDLWHYMYVDREELSGNRRLRDLSGNEHFDHLREVTLNFANKDVYTAGAFNAPGDELKEERKDIKFTLNIEEYRFEKPAGFSRRLSPGEIQLAISDVIQERGRLDQALIEYDNLIADIDCQLSTIRRQFEVNNAQIGILTGRQGNIILSNLGIFAARFAQLNFERAAQTSKIATTASTESIPKSLIAGTASGGDVLSITRGTVRTVGAMVTEGLSWGEVGAQLAELGVEQAKEAIDAGLDIAAEQINNDFELFLQQGDLDKLLREEVVKRQELDVLVETLNQAQARQQAAIAQGIMLLEDRARFRRKTAAQVQEFRHKDMAFRIFRNDLVQKYRAQFDQAAMYAFLAASVYDFETCLLDGDPRGAGQKFMTDIIRSRSLGIVLDGAPQTAGATGDPGLADTLARMNANWQVLVSQLGFNNPQTETNRFSMRTEMNRIADDKTWIQFLNNHRVNDIFAIPEFNRYAIPFAGVTRDVESAIVIPFTTMVQFGKNFFGRELIANDSSYDSTKFATKIFSVGVWFEGYEGLGLSNTPRVYLFPVGQDVLRSPTGNRRITRSWRILDQQIPVPFSLSGSDLNNPDYIPMIDGLSGEMAAIRRFGQFRAYHDGGFNPDELNADTRLIGRSVWNSRWLLIIPAGNLLTDRDEAIRRFMGTLDNEGNVINRGISDIKIFFQTYAYSGT